MKNIKKICEFVDKKQLEKNSSESQINEFRNEIQDKIRKITEKELPNEIKYSKERFFANFKKYPRMFKPKELALSEEFYLKIKKTTYESIAEYDAIYFGNSIKIKRKHLRTFDFLQDNRYYNSKLIYLFHLLTDKSIVSQLTIINQDAFNTFLEAITYLYEIHIKKINLKHKSNSIFTFIKENSANNHHSFTLETYNDLAYIIWQEYSKELQEIIRARLKEISELKEELISLRKKNMTCFDYFKLFTEL